VARNAERIRRREDTAHETEADKVGEEETLTGKADSAREEEQSPTRRGRDSTVVCWSARSELSK